MSASDRLDEEIISGYLQNYAGDKSLFWAFTELNDVIKSDPERAWQLTLELIRRTTDEATLAYVAAGPLEDMARYHGKTFIDRIEEAARKDPHFRSALQCIYPHACKDADVRKRIEKYF